MVEGLAIECMREYQGTIYDTKFRKLNPHTCFEDVTADGTNTILLIPESEQDGIESSFAPTTSSKRLRDTGREGTGGDEDSQQEDQTDGDVDLLGIDLEDPYEMTQANKRRRLNALKLLRG
jgi:hypothetical protein